MKVDAKTPITSMAYSHRYFNTSGAHALLTTVNNSAVMAMFTLRALPPEQALRQCLDVTGKVPPGESGDHTYITGLGLVNSMCCMPRYCSPCSSQHTAQRSRMCSFLVNQGACVVW
jgi:hypothetical protein